MREKVEMVGFFIGCLEFNGVMNQLCLKKSSHYELRLASE